MTANEFVKWLEYNKVPYEAELTLLEPYDDATEFNILDAEFLSDTNQVRLLV